MVGLLELWLPIVVSTVALFFASFLLWAVLPIHKGDVRPLPDEAAVTDHLKGLSIPPGFYMWPQPRDGEKMSDEAFTERYAAGPWGSMTVMPARPAMGRNLALTFAFYFVVSLFTAYILSESRAAGASFLEVFQIGATIGVMANCFGWIPNAIWFGRPVRWVVTDLVDGVIYAVIGGLVFALMWPEAAAAALPTPG